MDPEHQRVGDLGDLDSQRVGCLPRSVGSLVQDGDLTPGTEELQSRGNVAHAGIFQNALGTRIGHLRTVVSRARHGKSVDNASQLSAPGVAPAEAFRVGERPVPGALRVPGLRVLAAAAEAEPPDVPQSGTVGILAVYGCRSHGVPLD